MIGKITEAQKRIAVAAVIIIAIFLLFGYLVYRPRKNTAAEKKAELININNQIKEIEVSVGKDQPLYVGMELLQERLRELDSRLPRKEEESLQRGWHRTIACGQALLHPYRRWCLGKSYVRHLVEGGLYLLPLVLRAILLRCPDRV